MIARDEYTTRVDPARARAIPAMQRAARDVAEYCETRRPLGAAYARAVDDVLSWLDGEQSHNLIASPDIRRAAIEALGGDVS